MRGKPGSLQIFGRTLCSFSLSTSAPLHLVPCKVCKDRLQISLSKTGFVLSFAVPRVSHLLYFMDLWKDLEVSFSGKNQIKSNHAKKMP